MAAEIIENVTVNYTWNGEVTNDVILSPVAQDEDISLLFTIKEGIKSKFQIHLADQLGDVTTAYSGCGLGDTATGVDITNKTLEVSDFQVYREQCADVFDDTVFELAKKSGVDRNDLTGTQIQNGIITPLLAPATARDMFAMATFGDTGSGDALLALMDGQWTKLIAGVATYEVTKSSVSFGPTLAAGEALSGLEATYTESKLALKQIKPSDKAFYVTVAVFENYQKSLETLGGTDSGWKVVQDGVQKLYFRGIEVIPMYGWSRVIEAKSIADPHRILYTTKANHILGFDSRADSSKLKMWFSDDDDKMKYLFRYRMGYEYINADLQTITY